MTTPHEVLFGDDRLPPRFWAKVVVSPFGCWLWTASTGGRPGCRYGAYHGDGRMRMAHRWAYHVLVRAVELDTEKGKAAEHVHHECRNTMCVNPAHLTAVDAHDHLGHQHRDKTECPHGHPYDEANTRVRSNGHRACRTCDRDRATRNRERRRRALAV